MEFPSLKYQQKAIEWVDRTQVITTGAFYQNKHSGVVVQLIAVTDGPPFHGEWAVWVEIISERVVGGSFRGFAQTFEYVCSYEEGLINYGKST